MTSFLGRSAAVRRSRWVDLNEEMNQYETDYVPKHYSAGWYTMKKDKHAEKCFW
jgi:hypothetical protein